MLLCQTTVLAGKKPVLCYQTTVLHLFEQYNSTYWKEISTYLL